MDEGQDLRLFIP